MSCEQRENGTFSFTKTGYSEVMRTTRTMLQSLTEFRFEVATLMYDVLKENKKVKKDRKSAITFLTKNEDHWNAYLFIEHRPFLSTIKGHGLPNPYKFKVDSECVEMALSEIFRNDNNTLLKPRKTAFPKLTNKDKSFSISFEEVQIEIEFCEETLSASWCVNSGNRTVDRADDHYMTEAFFGILHNYKWKRGEGGETVCVAESFNDDPCSPDSEASTTRVFENLTKKEIKKREKRNIAYARFLFS